MNTDEVGCLDGVNHYPQTHTYCTLSSITFQLNKTDPSENSHFQNCIAYIVDNATMNVAETLYLPS